MMAKFPYTTDTAKVKHIGIKLIITYTQAT
jgi:hypothetical protein